MKNFLWKQLHVAAAFMALMTASSLAACSDDEEKYDSGVTGLTVSQELLAEGVTVARSGGTTTFAVQSLEAVQVSSSETWCTAQASSPTEALNVVTVTLTVQENTTTNDRTAVVTLTSGGQSQQVNVTQTAADGVVAEQPSYEVEADGGTLAIKLSLNGTPQITCNSDWIAQAQTKANMADATYTFTIGLNYAATARTGSITFTVGTASETVSVEQVGRAYSWVGMNSDAVTLAKQMYAGINIGNTMEVPGGETGWGNPRVSKEYIDGLKTAGFNAVRIPCAWDSHIINQETNEIDPAWLDRVSEVVGYCRANDMYAIVNIHWDGGWLEENCTPEAQEANNAKQHALWTQIANKLNAYDEYLLFAGCNEPNVETAEQMAVLKSYEQTFIDAVRATGGNNATRCLIVQGPSTDIDKTLNLFGEMPTDAVTGRLMLEVHYYTPWTFCGLEADADWGRMAYFWGEYEVEGSDRNAGYGADDVIAAFEKLEARYVHDNIPIILGEYGAMVRTIGENQQAHDLSRQSFTEVVTREAKNHGIVPFFWDGGTFVMIDRYTGAVSEQYAYDGLMQGAAEGTYPF